MLSKPPFFRPFLVAIAIASSFSILFWLLLAKDRLVERKDIEAVQNNIKAAASALTAEERKTFKTEPSAGNPLRNGLLLQPPIYGPGLVSPHSIMCVGSLSWTSAN